MTPAAKLLIEIFYDYSNLVDINVFQSSAQPGEGLGEPAFPFESSQLHKSYLKKIKCQKTNSSSVILL